MRPGALHAAPPAPVLWNLPGLPGSVDAYGKRIQGVAAWEALPAFTTADHSPLENAATWSLPSRPRGVFLSPLENPAHPSDGWPGFTTASTHQRRRRPIMAHERRQSEDPRGPTWPLTSTGNHSRRYAPTLATFVGLGGHLGRNAHQAMRLLVGSSVFSASSVTKSTTWSRVSWGTHWPVRAPQVLFLARHTPPRSQRSRCPSWPASPPRPRSCSRAGLRATLAPAGSCRGP